MRVKVLVFKQYWNSQMEICLLCEHGRVWLFASPWTVAPSRPSLLPHRLPALICVCSFMHSTNHCMCAPACLTLCNPVDCSPPGSSVHGILPGEDTGVRCHFQLQGIFLAQGLNLCLLHLLHWQVNSVPLLLLLLLLLLSHFSRVRLCASHRRQPPGSFVPGILHARDWSGLPVPFPTPPRMLSRFRRVQLCVTPWTAAHQALLSTGFCRQEHWSGCHFLLPRPTTNGEHFIKTEIKYSPIFILHLKYWNRSLSFV